MEAIAMLRVRIVADSTCDLPVDIRREHHIEMVPLNVHFEDEVFQDQVTISPAVFYEKLKSTPVLPRTSQPSPGDFVAVYERLASEPGTEAIVSIHLSSEMSGTYQSALLAGQIVKEKGIDVVVVDSRMASTQCGALVLIAAKAACAGRSKAEVVELIETAKTRIDVVFVVDTLEYLQKNGRIGKAAGLIGGLLHIKPILTVADGFVAPLEKIRGSSRAIPRMVEIMSERVKSRPPQIVYILNADCPDRARELESKVREAVEPKHLLHAFIGPVIGAHAGPGTLAVAWHDADLWQE
jgi:DegV family protein with EDD domain